MRHHLTQWRYVWIENIEQEWTEAIFWTGSLSDELPLPISCANQIQTVLEKRGTSLREPDIWVWLIVPREYFLRGKMENVKHEPKGTEKIILFRFIQALVCLWATVTHAEAVLYKLMETTSTKNKMNH